MNNAPLGPSSRLAPASPGGRDGLSLATAALTLLALVSIALLVFVALRPLPSSPTASPPAVVAVPSVPERRLDGTERQQLVDALTSENLFAHGRGEWVRASQIAQRSEQPSETAPVTIERPQAISPDERVVNALGQVLSVVEKEDLSNELQRAHEAVALKGLYVTGSGEPVAMIARKHLDKAGRSSPYRAGDEFEYQKDSENTWRVEHVDYGMRRVALSREGSTVWLRLRDRTLAMGGPSLSAATNRTFVPGQSVPVVVPTTQAALRQEMLDAGMSATEIDEYFALAASLEEPTQEEPKATGLAAGLMAAIKKVDAGDQAAGPNADQPEPSGPSGPGGIEALLKMMATGERPTSEMLEGLKTPVPSETETTEDKKDENESD